MLKWVHGKLKSAGGIKYPVSRRPLVIEPHLGGCDSGNACDESARKQSWQPRCEPNGHPSWVGWPFSGQTLSVIMPPLPRAASVSPK
jgi:hypothetical protein